MEKRIGTVTLLISDRTQVTTINSLISDFSDIILCRQGLPLQQHGIAVISLIVSGTVDRINGLCGRAGRLPGVEAKAVVTKQ